MKAKLNRATFLRRSSSTIFLLSMLAVFSGAAAVGQSIEYGGVFDDGELHVVPPNLTAHDPFLVQGTSQVGALVINGSHLRVLGSGRISVDENSIGDATGIRVADAASVEVRAGGRIDIIESSNGHAWGLIAEDHGTIDFHGTMEIDEEGNSGVTVGAISGSAVMSFGGFATAREEGNGVATGFRLSESGRLRFSGLLNLYESGNSNAIPIWASGSSRIDYSGSIYLEERVSATASGNLLENDAVMTITGGSLTIDTSRTGGPPSPFFAINDNAVLQISGGALRMIAGGTTQTPFMSLTGNSELRILGSDFNYPLGPVFDQTGVVSGLLRDGTPFSYEFVREEKARLTLIPEPGAGRLAFLAIASAGLPAIHPRKRACFPRGGSVG